MNIENRDYFRRREPESFSFGTMWGRTRFWSVTTWLIAINIAVFVLTVIAPRIQLFGYFSVDTAIYRFQIWRFLTFEFLNTNQGLLGFVFLMVGLYFFGPMVESQLGSRNFLVFYFLCSLAGALLLIVFSLLRIFGASPAFPLMGALSSMLGILVGAARICPDANAAFLFFPMKLRTLAWIFVGLCVYSIYTTGDGTRWAELGGGVAGWFLAGDYGWRRMVDRIPTGGFRGVASWGRAQQEKWTQKREEELEAEVDRILDKVHEHGMTSLTEREKQTLNEASRRRRKSNR